MVASLRYNDSVVLSKTRCQATKMKKKEERWEESVFLIKRLGEEEMTAEHRKPSTHTHSPHTTNCRHLCHHAEKKGCRPRTHSAAEHDITHRGVLDSHCTAAVRTVVRRQLSQSSCCFLTCSVRGWVGGGARSSEKSCSVFRS